MFLKILQNSAADLRPATFLKRDSAQVFSCELCKSFKSTSYTEHIRETVSIKNTQIYMGTNWFRSSHRGCCVRCSLKFRKTEKKTPVPVSIF